MRQQKRWAARFRAKFQLKRIPFAAGQIVFSVILLGAIITSALAFLTGQMTFPAIFAGLSSTIGIAATVLSVYSFFVPRQPIDNPPPASIPSGNIAEGTGASPVPSPLSAMQPVASLLGVIQSASSPPVDATQLVSPSLPAIQPVASDIVLTPPNNVPNGNSVQRTGSKTELPIFFTTPRLPDKNEFYGRKEEKDILITHIANGGSSSIVGKQKLGKSWLLQYLQHVAPGHSKLGPTYRVCCVNAAHPRCKSLVSFVQWVLEELGDSRSSHDLGSEPLVQLSRVVRNLTKQGVIPVLCIDAFEGFNLNQQEFDGSFFVGLRAITESDGLVLVTASESPLKELIRDRPGMPSLLFGIAPPIFLEPFTEQEVRDFVYGKSNKANFTEKERDFFLSLTFSNDDGVPSWPPLYLQLAGQTIFSIKQNTQGQSLDSKLDDLKGDLDRKYRAMLRN